MDDSNTLNSTEKLLNTIRGENQQEIKKTSIPSANNSSSQSAVSIQKNIKHSLVVGVLINDISISLVLTGKNKPGSDKELVKWAYIPIPEHLNYKSERFPAFLKSSLSDFLGKHKKVEIWAAIESKYLKLRNIIIPDLHESKIANAALWGLKKEFELEVDEEIFDYDHIEDTHVNGVKKKNIVAFSGNKKEIQYLEHLFSSAGFPLTGITAIPFAIQNFSRANLLTLAPAPTVFVNVARYNSEIVCLSDKGVLLTRSIRTGSYSLVEELIESEDRTFDHGDIPLMLSAGFDKDSPEFASIEHPSNRLLGKITRTGDYCSNTFANNEPVSKYNFFGETDNCSAFMEYAAEQVPVKIDRFTPFENKTSELSIKLPETAKERNRIIPAAGIALSSNDYSPNFLHTYLHKSIETKYKKMNIVIAAICIVCLLSCAGVWGWFKSRENNETGQLNSITKQLAVYDPIVTKSLLDKTTSQAVKKADLISRYAHDYLSLAVINEFCSLTPDSISIISFTADLAPELGPNPAENKNTAGNDKKAKYKRSITIKGIVETEYTALEGTLTGYVINLADSPLFENIILKDKKIEKKNDLDILRFSANMEIQ